MKLDDAHKIANEAILSALRVQIDALLSVLDESKRTQYQTALFEKTQYILDKEEKKAPKKEFELFRDLLQSAITRDEID